jgi:hypothetical protein
MIDFLGIGAQKAATTWIFKHLELHPQIHFPAGKEIHFWDQHRGRGVDWWLDQFSQDGSWKQGEITPAYALLEESTIREIYAIAPELRVFYSIRNPIARAWSAALMALERAEMAFDEASDLWFIDHFKSAGSRQRSDYAACLRRWRSVFPEDRIHLVVFDDIIRDPCAVLAGIADHIRVDPQFYARIEPTELLTRVFPGPAYDVRSPLLDCLRTLYRRQIEALAAETQRDFRTWMDWDGRKLPL